MNKQAQQPEISIVDALGKEIGYGHLMSLASALWRKNLKEKGYPEDGAFIPELSIGISVEAKKSAALYDEIISDSCFIK